MNSKRIICNTSPIIGLISIGKLSLLGELFDELILPEAVYRELCADSSAHQKEIDEIKDCVRKGYFKIYSVKNSDMVKSMYGFEYLRSEGHPKTGKYPDGEEYEVTLIYKITLPYTVTARYVDEAGNPLCDNIIYRGEDGEKYKTEQ